jgi:hypothetical protein
LESLRIGLFGLVGLPALFGGPAAAIGRVDGNWFCVA